MWTMCDELGPIVAGKVHEHLSGEKKNIVVITGRFGVDLRTASSVAVSA